MLLEVVFIVYLSFYILYLLLLLCNCLSSVFGSIIAIDADYSTDFRFHPIRGCCCFNSHNDVPQVAQRNVSIVAHTRRRNPYLPQPDCCRCAPTRLLLLCTIPHNDVPFASQRNASMAAEFGAVILSIAQPDCYCWFQVS